MSDRKPYLLAAGGGAVLWLGTALISGRSEAWDAPFYWTLSYPLSIALAAVLGYRFPERPWRWGLAVMWSQALVLVLSSASFGLLPLGLLLFAVLALPAIAVAKVGAKRRLAKPLRTGT